MNSFVSSSEPPASQPFQIEQISFKLEVQPVREWNDNFVEIDDSPSSFQLADNRGLWIHGFGESHPEVQAPQLTGVQLTEECDPADRPRATATLWRPESLINREEEPRPARALLPPLRVAEQKSAEKPPAFSLAERNRSENEGANELRAPLPALKFTASSPQHSEARRSKGASPKGKTPKSKARASGFAGLVELKQKQTKLGFAQKLLQRQSTAQSGSSLEKPKLQPPPTGAAQPARSISQIVRNPLTLKILEQSQA